MKWILYAILGASLAGGAVWAAATASQTEDQQEQEDDSFVPTERVPADSAISFPVDI
jgi:hypothetical protein